MRVCLVYDCLYPHTVGGAERWYRNVAERLTRQGHPVTYLTLRQWPRGSGAGVDGVRVVAVGPRMRLYGGGRRRVLPALVFGAGVLWHLLLHGRRYDVVHTASFPYFSVLAAALAAPVARFRLVVDWHEVWTRDYWIAYLGRVGGHAGWLVQRLCARVPQRAFCFSTLHAERLRETGLRGEPTVLQGQYVPSGDQPRYEGSEPVAVFVGRHIREKRVLALPPAMAKARARIPQLRCDVYGDGPDRRELVALTERLGLNGVVRTHGFVGPETLDRALSQALCMVLPSRREGYGAVVVEAAARGTPSVVVAGPDNAATELVEDGVNGVVAPSAAPADLATAIERVHAAGPALRRSTADWFAANSTRLSLEASLARVTAGYGAVSPASPSGERDARSG